MYSAGAERREFADVEVLVAAGMILRRNQHKASPRRFSLRRASEHRKDAKDCRVSGDDAETDRRDDCEAQNERHQERIHVRPTFEEAFI